MKLSIVIPIYNSIKNLQKCLDSVIESSIDDLECILVNDGSTDSSEVLCKTYAEADRRFVYIQKDRGGIASAKNSGLAHSRGRYLMFLNSDDVIHKEGWDRIAEVLNQEPVDFTAFSYQFQNEFGETDSFRYPMKGEKSADFSMVSRLAVTSTVFNRCTGILFDYEIIRRMKLKFQTDNPVYEDLLFVSEYLKYCTSGQLLNRPILLQGKQEDIMCKYSSSQRIDFLENLYHFYAEQIDNLITEMKPGYDRFLFSQMEEMIEDLSKQLTGSDLKESLADVLHHEFIRQFLEEMDGKELKGLRERIILRLMKKKNLILLAWVLHSYTRHK